jgi:hypothetical protein
MPRTRLGTGRGKESRFFDVVIVIDFKNKEKAINTVMSLSYPMMDAGRKSGDGYIIHDDCYSKLHDYKLELVFTYRIDGDVKQKNIDRLQEILEEIVNVYDEYDLVIDFYFS